MDFWITFWTILLIISFTLFAILAVVVTIGGFFDIRSLFKSLGRRSGEEDESNPQTDE